MPDRLTLVSDSVILPSFSLPTWSSSNSAALSKRLRRPTRQIHPVDHFDAAEIGAGGSINRPLLAGSGELPDSVTRSTPVRPTRRTAWLRERAGFHR